MSSTSPWTSPNENQESPAQAAADAETGRATAAGRRPRSPAAGVRRPRRTLYLRRPAAAQRPVSLAVAAGTAHGIPLPAPIRPAVPPWLVLLGAGLAELPATRPAPSAGARDAAAGRGTADPRDHRRTRQVHQGELAPGRRAAFRQHQDLRSAARRVFRSCRNFRSTFAGACSPSRARIPRGCVSPGRARTLRPISRTSASVPSASR